MKIKKTYTIWHAFDEISVAIIIVAFYIILRIIFNPERIKEMEEIYTSDNNVFWLTFLEKILPYLNFMVPLFFLLGLFMTWNGLGREYVLDDEKITIKYYFYSFLSLPKKKKILLDEIKGLVAVNDSVIIELNRGTETLDGLSKSKEVTEEIRKRVALKSSRAL